eukprot:760722-Hanusia_phi.AAC.4
MSVARGGMAFRVRTQGGGGSRWRLKGIVIEELIGEGAYGHVCRGREEGGEMVAVKKIFTPTTFLRRRAVAEVAAMRAMREHPNIVTLKSVQREGVKRGAGERGCKLLMEMYLLMELCSCSLVNFLVGEKAEEIQSEDAENLGLQMLDGVCFMHSCSIYHGDLNSKNILLKMDSQGHVSGLRICDFGMAGIVRSEGETGHQRQIKCSDGTREECEAVESSPPYPIERNVRQYRPPEVILNVRKGYEEETDVWAVGCLLVDLSRCVLPVRAASRRPLVEEISVKMSSGDPKASMVTEGILQELQHILRSANIEVSSDFLGKPTKQVLDSYLSHPEPDRRSCSFIPETMINSWISQTERSAPPQLPPGSLCCLIEGVYKCDRFMHEVCNLTGSTGWFKVPFRISRISMVLELHCVFTEAQMLFYSME